MALGDCFPTELINTTDLSIRRATFDDEWSDETAAAELVLGQNLSAIVVPARRVLTRDVDLEEDTRLADVILSPLEAPAGIQQKDIVRWTDFYGEITDAEVEEIERVSGVDGLESVVLRVGRRVI